MSAEEDDNEVSPANTNPEIKLRNCFSINATSATNTR